ncbi:nuclear hormone receptor HR96-like isoform X2 [Oppia nitens]|uniref:nuclear hormone receptor HR96-like isoform X2 n=1 Tax=Oppia nitens TaxID=1686743 RepID=UPI0023DB77B5|nr:nuclear hormone receptor HR96-like isoform X2 [Oppia nitens]
MSDQEFVKKCLVCGDKAIGNNFDALSCESCKAFFRRNAIKTKELKCHFDDNCHIDVLTRRFCKKCRLRKCFDIGMKKDWILSSEEKKERKKKIETNKKRRKHSISSGINTSDSSTSSVTSPESGSIVPFNDDFDLNHIKALEIPDSFGDIELDDNNSDEENSDEISDLVYQKAAELEFTVLPIARPFTDSRYAFNELEGNKLAELFNATTFFIDPKVPVTSQAMTQQDMNKILCNKVEDYILKVIKMSKMLSSFNNICENDKISLIKFGAMDLVYIRQVSIFDAETKQWKYVMDNQNSVLLSLDMMKELPKKIFSKYKRFFLKISKEWETDPVILDLLTAIVLFDPNRPRLQNKELIKLQQYIYMHLLQRYLQLRYQSESDSKLKFLKLLNTLIDLNVLGQTKRENVKKKDPNIMSPLMKEIFEVKSQSDYNSVQNTYLVF